jgi:hypothetical protein
MAVSYMVSLKCAFRAFIVTIFGHLASIEAMPISIHSLGRFGTADKGAGNGIAVDRPWSCDRPRSIA